MHFVPVNPSTTYAPFHCFLVTVSSHEGISISWRIQSWGSSPSPIVKWHSVQVTQPWHKSQETSYDTWRWKQEYVITRSCFDVAVARVSAQAVPTTDCRWNAMLSRKILTRVTLFLSPMTGNISFVEFRDKSVSMRHVKTCLLSVQWWR